MSKENLPIEVKNNQLVVQKRNNKRKIQEIKRAGKIVLNLGLAFSGLAAIGIGGPVGVTAAGVYVVAVVNVGKEILFKKQNPNSMFVTKRKLNGEISLSQDLPSIKSYRKIRGYSPHEKGAMMGLEMLVGLQNFKQQYRDEDKDTEPTKDGQNGVYSQIFSTVTHGINIKTIEALEKMGYLQVEEKQPKQKRILFFEKLGFKQYKEAREALFARVTANKEMLKEHEEQMYEIKFRITDKTLDLEQLYRDYLEVRKTRNNNPMRKHIKRIGIILEALKNRNIDIGLNSIGEYQIQYASKESFASRVRRKCSQTSTEKFRKGYKVENSQFQQSEQQIELAKDAQEIRPISGAQQEKEEVK